MNRLTEPYWLAWMRWHGGRKYKTHRKYAAMWRFRRLVRHLPEDGIAVDCGANLGDVSAIFLRQGLTVHAFEPDPDARSHLTRRLAGNPRLIVHPEAVGATAGRAHLYRKEPRTPGGIRQAQSSSLVRRERHQSLRTIEVDVVDLFDFIGRLKQRVAILKLDIEGAEVDILDRLLDERLDRAIDHIFVETHEKFSPEMRRRVDTIRSRITAAGIENVDLDWQ